jgi:hypothetical protein
MAPTIMSGAPEEGRDAAGGDRAHLVHVGGQSHQQVTGLETVDVPPRELGDPPVHAHPEPVTDLLTDAGGEPRVGRREEGTGDGERRHVERPADDPIEVAGEDAVVDDALDGLGDEEVEDHHPEERELGQQQPAAALLIGPDRREQPPDVRRLHRHMLAGDGVTERYPAGGGIAGAPFRWAWPRRRWWARAGGSAPPRPRRRTG